MRISYFLIALLLCLPFVACVDETEDDKRREKNEKFYKAITENPEYSVVDYYGAPLGVYRKVIKSGEGTRHANQSSTVKVHYKGWLYNGTVFDVGTSESGYYTCANCGKKCLLSLNPKKCSKCGELKPENAEILYDTYEFSLNNVVRGFSIALQAMVEGDHWEICIPYPLGYGETAYGSVPKYSTMMFDVELVEIEE